MPTTTDPREYRGHVIYAERVDDRFWRPVLDGDFYGDRRYLSSRDALRAAEGGVHRRTGRPVRRATVLAGHDDYFDRLRDEIRSDS